MLWDEDEIQVTPRFIHQQFVHMPVRSSDGLQWDLTTIYASLNSATRHHLWSDLNQLVVEETWAMIGDINCVLRDEERSSGLGVSSSFVAWWNREL